VVSDGGLGAWILGSPTMAMIGSCAPKLGDIQGLLILLLLDFRGVLLTDVPQPRKFTRQSENGPGNLRVEPQKVGKLVFSTSISGHFVGFFRFLLILEYTPSNPIPLNINTLIVWY